jgi:hypothetical protein
MGKGDGSVCLRIQDRGNSVRNFPHAFLSPRSSQSQNFGNVRYARPRRCPDCRLNFMPTLATVMNIIIIIIIVVVVIVVFVVVVVIIIIIIIIIINIEYNILSLGERNVIWRSPVMKNMSVEIFKIFN